MTSRSATSNQNVQKSVFGLRDDEDSTPEVSCAKTITKN